MSSSVFVLVYLAAPPRQTNYDDGNDRLVLFSSKARVPRKDSAGCPRRGAGVGVRKRRYA